MEGQVKQTDKIKCKIKVHVCVTVQHLYSNINSRLDAIMVILLTISISSTCFGREFRPSSGALDCVYSLWYKAPMMLPAGNIVGALYHKL